MSALLGRRTAGLMVVAMLLFGGCAGPAYEDAYPPAGVVVDRGWYYDPDYYDAYSVYHPRSHWYYDGHSFHHRDDVPRGAAERLRGPELRSGGHGDGRVPAGGEVGHSEQSADRGAPGRGASEGAGVGEGGGHGGGGGHAR